MKRGDYIRHRNGAKIGRVVKRVFYTNTSMLPIPSGYVLYCAFPDSTNYFIKGLYEFLVKPASKKDAIAQGVTFPLPPERYCDELLR